MTPRIALIGECMLELTRQSGEQGDRSLPMNMSYGGDTLNAAVYLARQGVAVDYVTALGDDPMSSWMVDQWRAQGVHCDLVEYHKNAVPGMYLVDTDDSGERSFYYWRDSAPARFLFDDAAAADLLFDKLADHTYVCLSGISLAIYSESSRQRLFANLKAYRAKGGKVVFDSNYRPKLWPSALVARQNYESMYRLTDIALPTIEDEQQVFGDSDQNAIIERLQSWGVQEIALKMGPQGCMTVTQQGQELVAAKSVAVVDTTSAGDSFNAGYLAARLKDKPVSNAAEAGHQLASIVIQYPGAIIPIDKMPPLPA